MQIIISFIITIIFITIAVLFLAYLEKRSMALFNKNFEPQTGFKSFFRPAIDAIKLILKEKQAPKSRKKILYFMAPLTVFCPVITAFFLIPLGENQTPVLNIAPSAILLLTMASIPVIGAFFAGFSCNNEYARLNSIRAVIQTISFEIPMGISLLAISFLAGSLNINDIIIAQNGSAGLFSWYFAPQIIGCTVFFICSLILLNCPPFNITKAENEQLPGYTAQYTGSKLTLFYFTEYALLLLISLFFVCLFFGGYLNPFGSYILPDFIVPVEQIFWLILKTFIVVFFIFLIKAALPKLSHERILSFSYKVLLPLSLINLNIAVIIQYFIGVN